MQFRMENFGLFTADTEKVYGISGSLQLILKKFVEFLKIIDKSENLWKRKKENCCSSVGKLYVFIKCKNVKQMIL